MGLAARVNSLEGFHIPVALKLVYLEVPELGLGRRCRTSRLYNPRHTLFSPGDARPREFKLGQLSSGGAHERSGFHRWT